MQDLITMKHMMPDKQPYELCLLKGPEALTDEQLLAVIIRTGTKGANSLELASEILALGSSEPELLGIMNYTVPQLMKVKGIGKVKAIQIQCIGELSKRIWKSCTKEAVTMSSPQTIAGYYMEEFRHKKREEMLLLLLNTKNKLIKDIPISKGTINSALISTREIFLEAIKYEAVNIILLHNHPSGDPTPSPEDLDITRRIQEAGELLDISLIDHIIIGDNSYISLKERGIL